jgi:tellurite resistance-related uncharacterized protein
MILQRKSFNIFADYFQLYVWDKGTNPQAPVEYSNEDAVRRLKAEPNVVVIQPERNTTVPVVIEIHDSEPIYNPQEWDHIAECSTDLPTGQLQVHECTGGPVAEIAVKPGIYRVRVFYGMLTSVSPDGLEDKDHYKAVLWPVQAAELKVLKQFQQS